VACGVMSIQMAFGQGAAVVYSLVSFILKLPFKVSREREPSL